MEKYARFRYQPCKPLGEDGRCITASLKHIALSKEAATEGMVLLKNESNALPLKKGEKIALFGKATIEYIKGGGGSGEQGIEGEGVDHVQSLSGRGLAARVRGGGGAAGPRGG